MWVPRWWRCLTSSAPRCRPAPAFELQIARIAVRSTARDRGLSVDRSVFVADAASVVSDPEIDIVVEVVAGIEPARTLVREALAAGKPVVTANKELLANHGARTVRPRPTRLASICCSRRAVAGAIPLIRPLRESLVAEPVQRIMGIVNGTTNYILTQMAEHNASYAEALSEAQSLGYAERDPTADVEGVRRRGEGRPLSPRWPSARWSWRATCITRASPASLCTTSRQPRRLGYAVKAVAVAERTANGDNERPEVAVRVHPAMVPLEHPLAGVRDSLQRGVRPRAARWGELMFYGRGAGGRPTASAVLGDPRRRGDQPYVPGGRGRIGRLVPAPDQIHRRPPVRLLHRRGGGRPARRPGVGGRCVRPPRRVDPIDGAARPGRDDASLVFITHECRERDLQSTLRELKGLEPVHELGTVMRVVGEDGPRD